VILILLVLVWVSFVCIVLFFVTARYAFLNVNFVALGCVLFLETLSLCQVLPSAFVLWRP